MPKSLRRSGPSSPSSVQSLTSGEEAPASGPVHKGEFEDVLFHLRLSFRPFLPSFADYEPRRSRLPIYTLRMPGVRLYIVNATSLISPIQRQVRNISFVPVTLKMHPTMMKLSPTTSRMISKDALEENGAVFGTPHLFHPSLNPGPQLDILNRKSAQIVASLLSKFAEKGPSTISLFDWVSRQVLAATTESVYGPQNPFRDPAVVAIRALVTSIPTALP